MQIILHGKGENQDPNHLKSNTLSFLFGCILSLMTIVPFYRNVLMFKSEWSQGRSDGGAEYLPRLPRPKRSGDALPRICNSTHLRILDSDTTALSQPAAQSILQNELVAARIFPRSDGIWITNTLRAAKGTGSFGKRHNKTHVLCRRCGMHSHHRRRRPPTHLLDPKC